MTITTTTGRVLDARTETLFLQAIAEMKETGRGYATVYPDPNDVYVWMEVTKVANGFRIDWRSDSHFDGEVVAREELW